MCKAINVIRGGGLSEEVTADMSKSNVSNNKSATAIKRLSDTSRRKRRAEESEGNRQKTVNSNGTDELTDKMDVIKGAKDESKQGCHEIQSEAFQPMEAKTSGGGALSEEVVKDKALESKDKKLGGKKESSKKAETKHLLGEHQVKR